jgi:MFS family permease
MHVRIVRRVSRIRDRLRRRGALWRNRDFLNLWAAQTVSQFGSHVSSLAIPLVAIIALEASAFEVSVLTALGWLPFFAFSLPVGVWVDRLPRRPLLIAADWGRAFALASIPLAYFLDVMTIGQLYAVELVVGTFTVLFDLSYMSYLPSVVERDELGEGNSKLEISRSTAQVTGPGLAGLLIRALSAPYAILVDSLSFVVSALFLSRIKRPEREPVQSREARPGMRKEIREGLRFVVRHPLLRPLTLFVAVSNIFVNGVFAILLVYAVRELDLAPQTIGLIFSLGGLGSIIGAFTANFTARTFGIGPTLIVTAATAMAGLFLIPLASGALVIPLLVTANVLLGFFVLNYFVTVISLIQAITPDHLLGRTNASRRFLVQGVIPVGALMGGALGSTIGLRETMVVCAVGGCASVPFLVFSPIRRIRRTEDADELVAPFNEQFATVT